MANNFTFVLLIIITAFVIIAGVIALLTKDYQYVLDLVISYIGVILVFTSETITNFIINLFK